MTTRPPYITLRGRDGFHKRIVWNTVNGPLPNSLRLPGPKARIFVRRGKTKTYTEIPA